MINTTLGVIEGRKSYKPAEDKRVLGDYGRKQAVNVNNRIDFATDQMCECDQQVVSAHIRYGRIYVVPDEILEGGNTRAR